MTWRAPSPRFSDRGDHREPGRDDPSLDRQDSADAVPRGGPVNLSLDVADMSQVGEARRAAGTLAVEADMSEEGISTVSIVATELAGNLARHARGGRVLLRALESQGERGVEILSVDQGPGIADIDIALRDGYSTGGTPGKGLGAVARLSTEFDVWSTTHPQRPASGLAAIASGRGSAGAVGIGTVIVARLWRTERGIAPPRRLARRDPGVVCLALSGERACGDAWWVTRTSAATVVVLVDGLGHGPDAARAADAAIACAQRTPSEAPGEIIRNAHGALRATRGAAMAVARIEHASRSVQFAGVGNIAGSIISGETSRGLASGNGIVGHQFGHVHEFAYAWPVGALLVLHTDGVSARWHSDAYVPLLGHDPSLLAASVYRDCARSHDDQTVVVMPDAAVQEADR